jgi:hypothetical protein
MGLDGLPDSGNKFTGSRMIVPGVGLAVYKVQKNDALSIKKNIYAGSIPPSPTPTPSITPTNTPTPTVTPTNTPTPSITPTPSPIPMYQFVFSGIGVNSISLSLTVTSIGGYVDWGDGNTTSISSYSNSYPHTYSTSYTGVITVNYYGSLTTFNLSSALPDTSTVVQVSTQEISNLTSLTQLYISYGRLVGQMSDLSVNTVLNVLNIRDDYTTSSVLSDLPNSLTNIYISLYGHTTISGNLSSISSMINLTNISVGGTNTITGDITNIPNTVTTIYITGNNTISGDIINLPSSLTQLLLLGNNTVTGNISNLPTTLVSLNISGSNTLYGNVSGFPYSLSTISIGGNGGNITGNLGDLVRPSFNIFTITTNNSTFSATTATIPVASTTMQIKINGNISGNVSNLPSSDFPSSVFSIDNSAGTSSVSYTSGVYPWGTVQTNYIQFKSNTPLTSTEVDNLIINIDSFGGGVTWISGSNPKTLYINGTRTAASNAARASLVTKGVTVTPA